MAADEPLTFEEIEAARARMGNRLVLTPLSPGQNLAERTRCSLFFKLENLQVSGSFKERGALNKLLQLSSEEQANGVVAASAGNHAQGVALHATRLGINSTIVMPEFTPLVKVDRTRRFGGEVVLHGTNYDEAYAHACTLCDERGATFIHAFDDRAIMAGQGTVGLEMLEQNPYLRCIVVPIGGGGLISGIAVAVKETNPKIQVIGVQTSAFPSMRAALDAGEPVEVAAGNTIADGIAVRKAGRLTYATIERYVDDVVTVDDNDISNAILTLLEEEKVVAEGAGAAGLAALLSAKVPDAIGRKTGVVICGGNIDTNVISSIIRRGLVSAGRSVRFDVVVPDQPGALAELTSRVAELRANVLEIHHEREFSTASLGETEVSMTLETRGHDHISEIRQSLLSAGFRVLQ